MPHMASGILRGRHLFASSVRIAIIMFASALLSLSLSLFLSLSLSSPHILGFVNYAVMLFSVKYF